MTELRYDPLFDRWVCIAENRRGRPFEFRQNVERRPGLACPFCAGNENQTPDPIDTCGGTNTTDWLVRVVPNKYPAFDKNTLLKSNGAPERINIGREISCGKQELIILSPRHVASISELHDDELLTSFEVFQRRVQEFSRTSEIQHICLFMNCRPQAGATIEHAHFQLIGSPICTNFVQQQYARIAASWASRLEFELSHDSLMLDSQSHFLTFCPFASSHAYQIRLVPRDQIGGFAELDPAVRDELAEGLRDWIRRLERCVERPAYNIVFYFPPRQARAKNLPWFIDVIPRLSHTAGFELGTDLYVNPTAPETAAARLLMESD